MELTEFKVGASTRVAYYMTWAAFDSASVPLQRTYGHTQVPIGWEVRWMLASRGIDWCERYLTTLHFPLQNTPRTTSNCPIGFQLRYVLKV